MSSERIFALTAETVNQTQGDVLMVEMHDTGLTKRVLGRPEVHTITLVDHSSALVELKRSQWGLFGVCARKLMLTPGHPARWSPPRGTRYDTICFGICIPMKHQPRDCIHEMSRFSRWLRSPAP